MWTSGTGFLSWGKISSALSSAAGILAKAPVVSFQSAMKTTGAF